MTPPHNQPPSAETSNHLNARISINVMSEQINIRLRDKDDEQDVRSLLRTLLRQIERLQREFGYGDKDGQP